MKTKFFILFFLICNTLLGQRYLTSVFSKIDSSIGKVYGTANNYQLKKQDLLFDFYAPNSDNLTKRPLIIYMHGGGFNTGTRTYPSVKIICRKMASKGYAVANIDYRLDPLFSFYNSNNDRRAMTDAMHDAKLAIRFFKANASLYKIDTNKIFIGGESAGAVTAMMAGFVDKQSELKVYPKTNPNDVVGNKEYQNFSNKVEGILCLCGTILDTNAIETNPKIPILWTHGTEDKFIPFSFANTVVTRAKNVSIPIKTKIYYGGTHCPWYFGNPKWAQYLDSTINDITHFLYPKVSPNTILTNDYNLDLLIKIYPNPSRNILNILLNNVYKTVDIEIVTLNGYLEKKWQFNDLEKTELNINSILSGTYLVKIKLNNNIVLTKKLIILK